MAYEVSVGLKIGAIVSGSLGASFGSAKSNVRQLGYATDDLTTKHKQQGEALSASLARGDSGVGRLRQQYDTVGDSIDRLKSKQEAFTASIARGEALKTHRSELRGQAMETAATGAVLGAPVVKSMQTAINFQDQTRDIAITGGFDAATEARLSTAMRAAALAWNQTQDDVAKGTAVLIAGGITNLQALAAYAPLMAKTATATRASMDDLGAVAIALSDNLGIGAAELERSMNMLAFAGKSGQFELADMAKWLPQLAPQFAALGITGERAVAEIGASLQIARRGAGTNDEAANNFRNFLAKIMSPETVRTFKKAGIDLKTSMQNMVRAGLSPAEAMIKILTKHLGITAPAAAAEYGKALRITDQQQRQIALARLDESYKLGALFADQQVLAFIRPALANQHDLADIQQGSTAAADKGVLDGDWVHRMGSAKEQLKELRINLADIGISIGNALLPAIVEVSRAVVPLMRSFSTWANENPNLIKGVVGVVGALVLGKMAFVGLAYGANLMLSAALSALFLGKVLMGTLLLGLKLVGYTVIWLGRALLLNPLGLLITVIAGAAYLIYRYWEPIKAFFVGLWQEVEVGFSNGLAGIVGVLADFSPLGWIYRAFAGVVSYLGVELPGTFSEFGRVLITGLVQGIGQTFGALKVSIVALGTSVKAWFIDTFGIHSAARAAIFRVWRPIAAFFGGLWHEVATGLDSGLAGIVTALLSFTPLGLIYRAFAGVMSYFGVELPDKFTEFGSLLITGLVNGISRQAALLKDSVVGIGTSVKHWFTQTLGIESPSRVFIGYGANISQGAALGISAQAGLVRQAALAMAAQSRVDMAPPNPMAVSRASRLGNAGAMAADVGKGATGAATFHFSPQITVPAGANMAVITQGLQASYTDWMRMMERYLHDQRRRSYGPADEAFV
ncbi:phage tail tape measure protein [Pseudomonas prosekii]|uniref:phage tail tape measure protein n=1 Tax=Pseudomonas prosekii TaxID=1148509 RepID=UPI00387ADE00